MDTTPLPDRIEELASADPAEAPDLADDVAAALEVELDATTQDDPGDHGEEDA